VVRSGGSCRGNEPHQQIVGHKSSARKIDRKSSQTPSAEPGGSNAGQAGEQAMIRAKKRALKPVA